MVWSIALTGKVYRSFFYDLNARSEHFLVYLTKVASAFSKLPQHVMIKCAVGGKINVVGDIHGNDFNLLEVLLLGAFGIVSFTYLATGGEPSANNLWLFLGDYVDRGPKSLEVLILLLSLKHVYGDWVTLLKGNHETLEVVREHNAKTTSFFEEVKARTDHSVCSAFLNRCLFVLSHRLGKCWPPGSNYSNLFRPRRKFTFHFREVSRNFSQYMGASHRKTSRPTPTRRNKDVATCGPTPRTN